MPDLSIIIPAYNEEKRIGKTLKAYYDFFSKKNIGFEIIVVANNCSDKTAEIVSAFSKKFPAILLLDIPEKIGKGGAVKSGIDMAKGSFVSFVDADNATNPEEFFKIFSAAKKDNCIAIGSRAMKGSKIYNQPFYRKALGIGFNRIARLLFSLDFHDTQCGAKVFPNAAAKKIFPAIFSNGWEFDVELLWAAKKLGLNAIEVPISWTDSNETKISAMSVPKMFFGLLKMRFRKTKKLAD